jgi:hypothetical protein
MTSEASRPLDAEVLAAVDELRSIISSHYPEAQFVTHEGDDPEGIYLQPVVDIDDPHEVLDVVMERLLQFQIEDGLPVYVFPAPTPDRARKRFARRGSSRELLALPRFP